MSHNTSEPTPRASFLFGSDHETVKLGILKKGITSITFWFEEVIFQLLNQRKAKQKKKEKESMDDGCFLSVVFNHYSLGFHSYN